MDTRDRDRERECEREHERDRDERERYGDRIRDREQERDGDCDQRHYPGMRRPVEIVTRTCGGLWCGCVGVFIFSLFLFISFISSSPVYSNR
jgi:hypothetical protein